MSDGFLFPDWDDPPDPAASPTDALPGTRKKLEVLAARRRAHAALWHPGDTLEDDRRLAGRVWRLAGHLDSPQILDSGVTPTSQIVTSNHGPLIVSSTYWGSAIEELGKLWISTNAGAIRVLVPRSMRRVIEDMRSAKYVICSRGPGPQGRKDDAMELLFEDGTDSPFSLHVGPESVDRHWVCSVWDWKKNKPHKATERKCFWRRAPSLPWLKPLEETS